MKVNIYGKDMRVNDNLEATIERKLSKFDRYFDDRARAEVKLQPEGDQVRAEVTFKISSHFYRAESKEQDAITAVNDAIDNMERQIRKHKSRMKKQLKEYAYMKEYLAQTDLVDAAEDEYVDTNIIRRKSFAINTMTVDEAVIQMEMLGHAFLLFLGEDTGRVCLVYKRNDGNYGLIEPEY